MISILPIDVLGEEGLSGLTLLLSSFSPFLKMSEIWLIRLEEVNEQKQ